MLGLTEMLEATIIIAPKNREWKISFNYNYQRYVLCFHVLTPGKVMCKSVTALEQYLCYENYEVYKSILPLSIQNKITC